MGVLSSFFGRRASERTSGKTFPRATAQPLNNAGHRRLDPPRLSNKEPAQNHSRRSYVNGTGRPAPWKAHTGSHDTLFTYHGSGYFGAVHEPIPPSSDAFDRKEMQAAFERWGKSSIEVQQDVERRVRDDEILRRRGQSFDHHRAQRVDDHERECDEALSRACKRRLEELSRHHQLEELSRYHQTHRGT